MVGKSAQVTTFGQDDKADYGSHPRNGSEALIIQAISKNLFGTSLQRWPPFLRQVSGENKVELASHF